MTSRRASVIDAPVIAEIEVSAWQTAYAGMMDPAYLDGLSVAPAIKRWRGRLMDQNDEAGVSVVPATGPVVGYVSYGAAGDSFPADRVGEVNSLYVHPGFWRRGYGRELLQAAIDELSAMGFGSAVLWVLTENQAARRFYSIEGWRDDSLRTSGSIGGRTVMHNRFSYPLPVSLSPS